MQTIRLADLPNDPDLDDQDPGTSWHPRPDKDGVRDDAGDLVDLDDDQVLEHQAKPERAEQPDAGDDVEPPAAEDSATTAPGVV